MLLSKANGIIGYAVERLMDGKKIRGGLAEDGEWDDWFKVTPKQKKVQDEYDRWQRISAKLHNNNLLKRMIYGEDILSNSAFNRVNTLLKREKDPYEIMKLKTKWDKIFVRLVGETRKSLGKDAVLKKYGKEVWSELLKDVPWKKS
jgi:hypothetical protein